MGALGRVFVGRMTQAVVAAFALASLCFFLTHALPGDLALRVAAARVGEERLTEATIARVREEAGLDRPLMTQYAEWLARLARGDLGRSLVTRRSVGEELSRRMGVTLTIGLAGLIACYLLAAPLGFLAGLRPRGRIDHLSAVIAGWLAAMPSFLIGMALIWPLSLWLGLLPPAGSGELRHTVLPVIALGLALAAPSIRVVRHAVAEARGAFHMTFARLKGLAGARLFLRHGLRNAAIPVVAFGAVQMTQIIDGFIVVEALFNLPGIGALLVDALIARDVPVIQGAALLIGLLFAGVNLIADIACLALDPRQRIKAS